MNYFKELLAIGGLTIALSNSAYGLNTAKMAATRITGLLPQTILAMDRLGTVIPRILSCISPATSSW